MTKEVKNVIKLVKYGNDKKASIITGIFCALVGIFVIYIAGDSGIDIQSGFIFILISSMLVKQIAYSLLYSGLMASSPKRRALEITLPCVLDMISGTVCYIVFLAAEWIKQVIFPVNMQYGKAFVLAGMLGGLTLVYHAASLKSFWFSTLGYMIAFFLILVNSNRIIETQNIFLKPAGGAVIGFLLIFLSVFIANMLRRLLYRRPLSRYAIEGNMRKQM